MPLRQTDSLELFAPEEKRTDKGDEFSAFTLLDPDPGNDDQVFCAMHLSYGAYHAGVVCNDVSTNYDFTGLPSAQQEVLEEFQDFLLKFWKELEKQNLREIELIQKQYEKKQNQFSRSQAAAQGAGGRKATVRTAASRATTVTKRAGEVKPGEVSQQLKVEYMLRFFARVFLRSTFPLVPLQFLKDLMVKQAKMSFKDTVNVNKLYQHLADCAEQNLAQLPRAKREFLRQCN